MHFQEHSLEKKWNLSAHHFSTLSRVPISLILCPQKKTHQRLHCISFPIASNRRNPLGWISLHPFSSSPNEPFRYMEIDHSMFFFLPPSIRASQNRPTMMVAGKPHRYEGEAAAAGGTKLNPKPTNCIMLTKVRVVIGFPSEFKRLDRIGCLCLVAFLAVWW